jgi:hypothetical protein
MRFALVLSASLFFMFLVLPQLILAQQSFDLQNYLGSWFSPENLAQFLFPNLPPEYLRIPQVIWYVIVPFIAVFTVLYGLLRELRIFRFAPNKVNVVLAFAMSMLLLPSGVLTFIVVNIYSFGAAFGAIAFIVVFMIGILLWGLATSWRLWGDVSYEKLQARNISDMHSELRHLQQEKIRLVGSLRTASAGDRVKIENHIVEIDKRIVDAEGRMQSIKRYG